MSSSSPVADLQSDLETIRARPPETVFNFRRPLGTVLVSLAVSLGYYLAVMVGFALTPAHQPIPVFGPPLPFLWPLWSWLRGAPGGSSC